MLLDTSGLLCYCHQREPQHAQARQLLASAPRRITHSYVIAELVALADSRRASRTSVLEFVDRLGSSPLVEVVYVDERLHRRALDLLRQRLDKAWSLCDAVSFLLMRIRGLTEALTTDHHFEQAGFVRLLPR